MIGKEEYLRKICKDLEKVENYERAVSDKINRYELHHLEEDDGYLAEDLKRVDRYFDVEPEKLIFLTKAEHLARHRDMLISKHARLYKKDNPMYKPADPEVLYKLRVEQRMTLTEIGAELNMDRHTVRERLNEYEIPDPEIPVSFGRKMKEETKQKISAGRIAENNPVWVDVDINLLRDLYVNKKMNYRQIEKIMCISHTTIKRRIQRYGITRKAEH